MRIGPVVTAALHVLPRAFAAPIPCFKDGRDTTLPARSPDLNKPQVVLRIPDCEAFWPRKPATEAQNITVHGLTVTLKQIAQFAPVVSLHPNEPYLPASVLTLLNGSTLDSADARNGTVSPTQRELASAASNKARLRLHPASYSGDARSPTGQIKAPMYVSVQVPASRAFVDLNFVFLYAFNGAQTARVRIPGLSYNCAVPRFAEHEGDVESATVRVDPSFTAIQFVRVESHGHSTFLRPRDVAMHALTHPRLYAGLHSHATYAVLPAKPQHEILTNRYSAWGFGIDFVDMVSTEGATWKPFDELNFGGAAPNGQLVLIGIDGAGEPIAGQEWSAYRGTIGAAWSNVFTGAQSVGKKPLSWAQRTFANVLAHVATRTGLVRHHIKSDGTAGLGERGFIRSEQPTWTPPWQQNASTTGSYELPQNFEVEGFVDAGLRDVI